MDEQKPQSPETLIFQVKESVPDVAIKTESENLESIRWYLQDLNKRVLSDRLASADEFAKATKSAEKSLTELLAAINNK